MVYMCFVDLHTAMGVNNVPMLENEQPVKCHVMVVFMEQSTSVMGIAYMQNYIIF